MSDNTPRSLNGGFSPVTDNDHAGELWIIAILGLVYSAFAAFLRIRIKWSLLGYDDLFTMLGFFAQIAQATVVFYGLQHGIAKANSETLEEDWSAAAGKVRVWLLDNSTLLMI